MHKNMPHEGKKNHIPAADGEDYSIYYPDGDYQSIEEDDNYEALMVKKKKVRKKRNRITGAQRGLIFGIFLIYAIVLCAAAWLIFYKPADPDVNDIPFDTNPVTQGMLPGSEGNNSTNATGNQSDSSGGYNALDGTYNILLVGHDRAASLADVIMLVNCDTKEGDITVMQLPRDTCVQNFVTNKINAAYSTYYNAALKEEAENPYQTAVNDLAVLLEQSLCIQIHHTAVLNLDGLVNIVNALGGVEIYVPEDMYYTDPEQDLYINIAAGHQTLTGEQAENFVRYRTGYTQADLGRVNAQKIFMTALLEKVKNSFTITGTAMLTRVAEEVLDNLHTDLTLADMIFYAKFLLRVNLADVTMTTIPGNAVYDSLGHSYYVVNRAATLAVINAYYNIYDTEISDAIFDRNVLFCLDDNALTPYYYADTDTVMDGMYNGQEISDDSIYIP